MAAVPRYGGPPRIGFLLHTLTSPEMPAQLPLAEYKFSPFSEKAADWLPKAGACQVPVQSATADAK